MNKVIDGKKLAALKEEKLKDRINKLPDKPEVVSFLIGDDQASWMYTNMKQEKAQDLGIDFQPLKYPADTSFEEILEKIKGLNEDPEKVGIMVQLPLPKEFLDSHKTEELLEAILPKKDIDGLNPKASEFIPATAKGVLTILDSLDLNFSSTTFAVVGSEGEVGQATVLELSKRNAKTVTRVDKKIPGSKLEDTREADVVISATGVRDLIKPNVVKDGVIVIDVGLGDFAEEVYEKSSRYTPKYGGVGPMTVISLMENIVEAAEGNASTR
jgi:methylenetetrahydrofolate dehydrogenase (NADP+)/methenyltetrahydrofolate cyclohydrolase